VTCQRCKKSKATVEIVEIEHGEKREKHLCEQCAVSEGVHVAIQPKQHVAFNQLLTDFVVQQANAEQVTEQTCTTCGATFADFRHIGLLGCPDCYDTFEKALVPLMHRAHGTDLRHVGKTPHGPRQRDRGQDLIRERARLERELADAIEQEDFERAAQVRDSIKSLDR